MAVVVVNRGQIPALTGARALAALWVALLHAGLTDYGDALGVFPIKVVTFTGHLGVGFFFVLSGFMLTHARADELPVRTYVRRRLARIYPVYLLVLVAMLLVNHRVGEGETLRSAAAAVLLIQSWFPEQSIYHAGTPAMWSLSAEATMYCSFGWLVRAMRLGAAKTLQTYAALASIPFAIGFVAMRTESDQAFWTYFFPPSRLPEFALGILAAELYRRGRLWKPPGLPLAVVMSLAVLVVFKSPTWIERTALFVPLWPLAIACIVHSNGLVVRALENRVLVFLGEISFSFYLVHMPVLDAVGRGLGTADPSMLRSVTLIVVALGVSVALASVLFLHVERPMTRRLGGRPEKKNVERVLLLSAVPLLPSTPQE